ncbi:MAG: aminopeptidase [Actinomycetota bacterium]|nr:aminopeptidase [Actinomycetota bacterium]
MADARIEKLADILVDYSTEIKKDDLVSIKGTYVAEPLILALYSRVLERGAHAVIRATIPRAEPIFYRFAQEHQLEFVWDTDVWLNENLTASFSIISDTNTRQLSRVPTEKQTMASRARKPMFDTFFNRAARNELRWNVTLFPTEALAMEADMSLDDYSDLFYEACLVEASDPVAEWRRMAQRNAKLAEWMKERTEVHLEAEGTDLTLDVGGRTFIPSNGRENFPDGEFFTGPVEDKTRGHVTFSFPAICGGQVVEGVRLEFEAGKVVAASAAKNEDFLIKMLDADPGARVLGELGIGTNYGIETFMGETLLDEKIGGTVHLAVGASYPETGGVNESAIHWDMVCDLRRGGRITVDGDVLQEDGRFLV